MLPDRRPVCPTPVPQRKDTHRSLVQFLSSLPEVVAGSVRQVRVLAFTFIGTASAMVTVTTFQGTGQPGRAMLLTLMRLG
jgi:Na+-driven multidrug efflux pump